MAASASVRTMSAVIITRRLSHRSTHAPAGRPTIRKAAVEAAFRMPICHATACSRVTASTGTASDVNCSPKTLTPCPPQSQQESGVAANGFDGRHSFILASH